MSDHNCTEIVSFLVFVFFFFILTVQKTVVTAHVIYDYSALKHQSGTELTHYQKLINQDRATQACQVRFLCLLSSMVLCKHFSQSSVFKFAGKRLKIKCTLKLTSFSCRLCPEQYMQSLMPSTGSNPLTVDQNFKEPHLKENKPPIAECMEFLR